MKTTGNITLGQSSVKEHIRNGSGTICHRNTLNKVSEAEFIANYKTYPEMCCAKCTTYLKQRNKL
jgi:hypothetical protein